MGHVEDYSVLQEKARPLGRSLSDFGTLKPAELALLNSCRTGEIAKIAATRPTKPNAENTVRAGFLRFLILGGDNETPIHEHGIQLQGAYIKESLGLKATSIRHDLRITHCTFLQTLDLTDAKFGYSVALDDCVIPGLQAQRLIAEGMLSIQRVTSHSLVSLDFAQIGGSLYLSGASLCGQNGYALSSDGAVINGDVFLANDFKAIGLVSFLGAQIGGQLNCKSSSFKNIAGDALCFDRAVIKGGVFLINGFKAVGRVSLAGVHIGGQLNCTGASLDGKSADALFFDGAVINGDVMLCGDFSAAGQVRLMDAQISGQLNCSGASLDGNGNNALSFDGAVIKGDVMLYDDFKSIGEVRFLSAQISGQLNCNGARLEGKNDDALCFDGAVIKGDAFLWNLKAIGLIRFRGAQIGGQLNCKGASLDGKNGQALSFDGAVIKRGVFLNNDFKAIGQVRFIGAQIGGQLNCKRASFDGKDESSLSFDRAVIKGIVLLGDGFNAIGQVRLLGAQIDGQLNCKGASFDGKDGNALALDGAVIKGSVFLSNDFKALGEVRLLSVQIGGSLICNDASFDGNGRVPFKIDRARVNGTLVFLGLKIPLKNASFSGAKVAALLDDEDTWGSDLNINGFVYDFLDASAPVRANSRLAWLDKQSLSAAGNDGKVGADSKFCPQPWLQLQNVLREMGHTEEALEVGLAFERRLRKAGLIGQPPGSCPKMLRWLYSAPARGLHYAYGLLTGFGYKPIRLLVWFLATWLACTGIYWWAAAQEGVFAPSNPIVFQHADYVSCRPDRESVWRKINPAIVLPIPKEFTGPGNWYLCENLREEYTGFSPLTFSLDVLLPLVDLQQEKDWAPMIPTPKAGITEEFTAFGWKYFTRLMIWLQTLFGWVLSLLLVAIVSGLTRRRE